MNVKSDISNEYLAQQMEEHGGKPYPAKISALMTGAWSPTSIGYAISQMLKRHDDFYDSTTMDVRHIKGTISPGYNALIMCHGVSHLDWFENAPMEKMQEIVDVNLTGTIRLTQAFVKATIETPVRKRIIAIGSMAHRSVLNGSAAYCASKAGLAMLCRCLAWELAPKGYDVYCIHPSNTYGTPMSEQTIEGLARYRCMTREDAERYWNDSAMRDESLRVEEIADLVGFILHRPAAYLSGCNIELAGGQR